MRMQGTLVLAAATCLAGQAVALDITLEGQFRQVTADSILKDNGNEVDSDGAAFLSDTIGPFDVSFATSVSQQGIGQANAVSSQVSFIGTTGFTAEGFMAGAASATGEFTSAEAGALNIFVADFSVTESTTFDLAASIFWTGDPYLLVVKLRTTSGADFFVLANQGPDGAASDSVQITLEPGNAYEVFGIMTNHIVIDGPDGSGTFEAGFSLSLVPIPAPSSLALAAVGMLAFGRRRQR